MFTYATPEEVGISSKSVKKYLEGLEKARISTHALIIMRNDKIVFEHYWAPFHKDYLHRIYSVTKSFVSIAVGFAVQDGLVSLDDKIVDLFPPEITKGANPRMQQQTVRNMLMMSTGWSIENEPFFATHPKSRLRDYFENSNAPCKQPGTFFDYDSTGSFVLGAMVEELTGKKLLDYLREKLFDKIGVSEEIDILSCPGGHSWGDSALLIKPIDLLKVARFVMNLGEVNGEQILSREYLQDATSGLIAPARFGDYEYGYQFWTHRNNSFFFNGMGSQYALCIPEKDLILIHTGDTQSDSVKAQALILDNFQNLIADDVTEEPLPADDAAYAALKCYSEKLVLYHCRGSVRDEIASAISGKTFVLDENPMGMKEIRFSFSGDEGIFEYVNAQGEKKLPFGFSKNVFGPFPQTGYSDRVGGVSEPGHQYQCAASAQWQPNHTLELNVQIIDRYFGRLHMYFHFSDKNTIAVRMYKVAEYFLNEYTGYAEGKAK